MRVDDLLDRDLLAWHLEAGDIKATVHPTEPLTIFWYTNRCIWTKAWDHVTLNCRGLIVNHEDGTVVARGMAKFFQLGEHGEDTAAGPLTLLPPISVFDKVDGSLGIAYRRPSDGVMRITTKSSFLSPQAEWANRFVDDVDGIMAETLGRPPHGYLEPVMGATVVMEIVCPQSKVIVDYDGQEGLVLIGLIDIATGEQLDVEPPWHYGPTVHQFPSVSEAQSVLAANPRPNSEGYVLLSADRVTRVKVKEGEYLRLHALLSKTTTRTIWEYLRTETPLDRLLDTVPDEFTDWIQAKVDELHNAYNAIAGMATIEFDGALQSMELIHGANPPEDAPPWRERVRTNPELRRTFSTLAAEHENPHLLFLLLDDDQERFALNVWGMIRPEAEPPYLMDPEVLP